MLFTDFPYVKKKTKLTPESVLMVEGKPRSPKSPTKELSDSDTSEEEQLNPSHKTSEEERDYGTI